MITTVIRSYNEANHLKRLLPILKKQSIPNDVVIVDSFSTDDTVAVAEKYKAKIVQVKKFTYGKGLNRGIEATTSKYICALSAHCFPANDNFLLIMKGAFGDRTAGSYARQTAVPESNIMDKRNLALIFRNEKIAQTRDYFFNNAASMFKRGIWQTFKFNEEIPAFEDLLWAKTVQGGGYNIVYEPNALVYHYHDEGYRETMCRYEKEYTVLESFFRPKNINNW